MVTCVENLRHEWQKLRRNKFVVVFCCLWKEVFLYHKTKERRIIMKITLVTGNWAKLAQAKKILEPLGHEVTNVKMDTPEIQADTV
jgi:hypothetical protein